MKAPKIFNNITERLVDDLKASLDSKSRLSIAAASFSIYAYEALKEELEIVKELRFLFTSPTFSTDKTAKQKRELYIPKLNRERNLYGSEFEIRLRNQLTQRAIDNIIHIKEEKDIDSLFSIGETTTLTYNIKGMDDFELITFLIIK